MDLEHGVLTLPLPKSGKIRHVPWKTILRSCDSILRSSEGDSTDGRPCVSPPVVRTWSPSGRDYWCLLAFASAYGGKSPGHAGVDLVSVKQIVRHRDLSF